MKNNNNNYGILANFIIINMVIFIIYFSNIKSLLEVYGFNYKQQVLEIVNEINLDTSHMNEYFINFKKSYFIEYKKEISFKEEEQDIVKNTENLETVPLEVTEKQLPISSSENKKDVREAKPIPLNQPIVEKDAEPIGGMINNGAFKLEKIMIAGDSVAQSLEYGLKKIYPKMIENRARHSTGLTVPSYFDWGNGLKEYLTSSQNSNVIIFMVGANDAQDLYLNKRFLSFGTQNWKDEYKSRVIRIMDIINEFDHIKKVIWIGQPIMKSKNFDQKMEVLNSIYMEAIQEKNDEKFLFLSTRELLSINGEYSAEIDNKPVRASDGIHLGMYGTTLIAIKIKELLE